MGRRSTHTPQQLRELILDAAQDIIEAQGIAGLSAREIARRIGYSPGTIYNMFENLDDVVLNIEARVLDALDQRLAGLRHDRVVEVERFLKFGVHAADYMCAARWSDAPGDLTTPCTSGLHIRSRRL